MYEIPYRSFERDFALRGRLNRHNDGQMRAHVRCLRVLRRRAWALILLGSLYHAAAMVAPASAQSARPAPAIAITDGWARETAPMQVNGGGFLTIINKGTTPDRLVSASSPAAPTVQLHTMSMDGGVMRMRELPDGIVLPARSSVELQSGGRHIMFIGLKSPLRPGQNIALTLRFEKAGLVRVVLPVRAMVDRGQAEGSRHDHH